MIHVLGDGPYAREVAHQAKRDNWIHDFHDEIKFISAGMDASVWPSHLVNGIANPNNKRYLIEKFYEKIEGITYVSVCREGYLITEWDHWRCVNIGPLTTVGLNVDIGDFVSICANVTIGHDVTIGKYSTICPGAVVSGNVAIHERAFIGAGAIVLDNITIGSNVVVGAGAVVIRDVEGNRTVVGNPARAIQ